MSLILRQDAVKHDDNGPRAGAAFLVEAMVLLVFIAASLAVLVHLYATSLNRSAASEGLSNSVAIATDAAEQFQADPLSVAESTTYGDLLVRCDVTNEPRRHGTLYSADIKVYDLKSASETAGQPIFALSTARYVSEVER